MPEETSQVVVRNEELTLGSTVIGILPGQTVSVVDVKWHGSAVVELTHKDSTGNLGNQLLYRDNEPERRIDLPGRARSFDGDGATPKVVSEAFRIRLAHLFDPLLAAHTSLVDPLPHQKTAVYERCDGPCRPHLTTAARMLQ